MHIACLDLEGVLVPEIWIGLAERTGIDDLRATTRDVPDYDELMRHRLGLLETHRLGLPDLRAVVDGLEPLAGAPAFLDWLRASSQVAILSDTFYELAGPLIAKLGHPMLCCHHLEADDAGRVTGYRLRQADPKRRAVAAFQGLNFRTIAVGDSYNDTSMLGQADVGLFYRPPEVVVRDFPNFPVCRDHDELRAVIAEAWAEAPAPGAFAAAPG